MAVIDGVPTTSPEKTVADLVRLKEDPSLVANFVEGMASRGHIFDRRRCGELLTPLAARNGYRKGDGESFAADIVGKNASPAMLGLYKRQVAGIEAWADGANAPLSE